MFESTPAALASHRTGIESFDTRVRRTRREITLAKCSASDEIFSVHSHAYDGGNGSVVSEHLPVQVQGLCFTCRMEMCRRFGFAKGGLHCPFGLHFYLINSNFFFVTLVV